MTHLDNAPSHTLTFIAALICDGVVVYGITWTWLTIRATARPACTCDRARPEEVMA